MPRRALVALGAAVLCGLAGAAVWISLFFSDTLFWLDGAALQGFVGLRDDVDLVVADFVSELANPEQYVIGVALVLGVAAYRRRWLAGAVALGILAGANLTTQVLKPLLAEPRYHEFLGAGQISDASWPSGHTTAAIALALCAVLVAAPRWRPLVAVVGALTALGVIYSILLLGWHYPSDVLGGMAVATGWTCLGLAALWTLDRESAVRPLTGFKEAGVVLGSVVATTLLFLLARAPSVVDYAQAHTSFVAGALALAAAVLALAAAVTAAVSRA